MKTLFITLLTGYQTVISPLLHQLLGQQSLCRYEVSCSEYAKQAIKKHGVLKGGKLALLRLVSCQPFTKTYASI